MASVGRAPYSQGMVTANWQEFAEGLDDNDLAKLRAFRSYCLELPAVEERTHCDDVTSRTSFSTPE